MVRLLLIRHAATDASQKNIFLGSTDMEATPAGLEELKRLRPHLDNNRANLWYCSPLIRAVQTAEKLQMLGIVDPRIITDRRLSEVDLGRWEQKSFAEIEQDDPELIPSWSEYDDFVFPDGESVAAFSERLLEMLAIFKESGAEEIGVITHGGVIRTMICLALGLSPKHYLLFNIHPASLTILDLYPQGGVLSGLNL